MSLRIAIATLGCKVNWADGERLMSRLGTRVHQVPFTQVADLYVVNSCTVTATADRQSRQLINRARRLNPEATVFLAGCLAAVGPESELQSRLGVDGVFPLASQDRLVSMVRRLAEQSAPGLRAGAARPPSPGAPSRTRPFLKVQDGCDQACTYCIVPTARGPSRSTLTSAEVASALRELARGGYGEVVLTGIHLGRYGIDLDPSTSLARMLSSITSPAVVGRVRLSSIEVGELTPDLIQLFEVRPDRICPHLHVPIQSGDDAILAAMNRPYRRTEVADTLQELRRRMPDAALGTDLIAGFPGETETQHEATVALVRGSPLTHLHVFPYSPRPDTPAARLAQLPKSVRAARARRLREAGAAKLRAFVAVQLGKVRTVLFERRRDQRLLGLADNYLRVEVELPVTDGPDLVGQLVDVELQQVLEGEEIAILGRVAR